MAVETGAIFKRLYFDGTSSGDFGVYISGTGTFNAPARDIEMVSIPGRNGALALDRGRFENIEVTYKAGLFGVDEADFAEAISDFRNFLCSRSGYVRLEDDYNPDEYRMAVYKSGLDVKADVLKAGEFDLVFDCKPQRWLKSGETAVTVTSGDTLTNPTMFDASPLLEIIGEGDISINGSVININGEDIGTIPISEAASGRWTSDIDISISSSKLNEGDTITAEVGPQYLESFWSEEGTTLSVTQLSMTNLTRVIYNRVADNRIKIEIVFRAASLVFQYGTAKTITGNVDLQLDYAGSTRSLSFYLYFIYDGNSTIRFVAAISGFPPGITFKHETYSYDVFYGYSTKPALPEPLYVDLNIGEAYGEIDGEMLSLNSNATLPNELPTLPPGETAITFSDHIEDLKIRPNWWKV